MTRTTVASLLALAVAGVVAEQLGGRVGLGCMLGALAGTGMCGIGLLHQRHVLGHRPEQAMQSMMVSFLAKLVVLMVGALAFRYLEPVAARADWKSFLIAYAGVVALVLPIGTLDLSRLSSGSGTGQVRPSTPGAPLPATRADLGASNGPGAPNQG